MSRVRRQAGIDWVKETFGCEESRAGMVWKKVELGKVSEFFLMAWESWVQQVTGPLASAQMNISRKFPTPQGTDVAFLSSNESSSSVQRIFAKCLVCLKRWAWCFSAQNDTQDTVMFWFFIYGRICLLVTTAPCSPEPHSGEEEFLPYSSLSIN